DEVDKVSAEIIEMEKTVFPRSATQPSAADSPAAAGLSGNIITSLKTPPPNRAIQFLHETINAFKEKEPKYAAETEKLLKAVEEGGKARADVPKVMVMEEMPKPREAFVLVKGSYDKHADQVTANTPTTLPAMDSSLKKDRLALAKWLFAPEHPLTARVA